MQFFEVLFLINTLFLLAIISFYGNQRKLQIRCFQLGLVIFILHVIIDIVRWQMAFAILIFAITSLLLLRRTVSHGFFRILGFIMGLMLIITSAFYTLMMPIMELPAPTGEYLVGSTNFTITDRSRQEIHSADPEDHRELFVEVWYPADLEGIKKLPLPNLLWQELYTGKPDRVHFFMNYLKGIDTHSYPDIPPFSNNETFPVILFNHGLQMFTSQSTLLMEHLASHGYIVVSIAHPYESLRVNLSNTRTVIPEFISSMEKFNEAMKWIQKTSGPINSAKDSLKTIESKEERARVILKAIEKSEMNHVVSTWEKDNQFILDQLISINENRFIFQHIMDTSRIGIMGMSIGGAVSAEFAKTEKRIKAGINIDGLQYGNKNKDSLEIPFMMIYSEDGKNINEFLSLMTTDDYHEYSFANTRHADFSDMTMIWPFMRVYGQLGNIPGERMTYLTNRVILNFWDHYFNNKPLSEFDKNEYPELEGIIDYKRKN